MKKFVFHLTAIIIVFVLFFGVFFLPLPVQFETHGILVTDEIILFVIALLLYLVFGQTKTWWHYVGFFLSLLAFALPLLRLWETAESTWNIILGLFPWLDALGYYSDANSLINGGVFSAFSGRRPIFASLLAFMLYTTDQNLQLVLIAFVILNAAMSFLFALEVQKEFGTVAAVASLYFLQFFYRPYVGTTLTEQLGIPVGVIAFTVLLRSISRSDWRLFSMGLMILTFSLFVRVGALLVLPVLFLFGIFFFIKKGYPALRVAGVLAVSILIPVSLNVWLGRIVASSDTVQFGNFSYTLYGQAVGGKRWTQVLMDYPELNNFQEPELSREIYRLAFKEIGLNPFGLIQGIVKAWKDFIIPSDGSAFGFFETGNKQLNITFQIILMFLFLAGIGITWLNKQNPVYIFLLVFGFGIFMSIPFLPPVDAGIRPYAATIVVIFFPILVSISKFSVKWRSKDVVSIPLFPYMEIGLSLVLIIVSVFGGVYVRYGYRPQPHQPSITCPSGLVPVKFKISTGSYLYFVASDSSQQTRVPVILFKHVFRSFRDFPYGDFASAMRKIKEPVVVTLTTDFLTGIQRWIVAPPELIAYRGKIVSACGRSVSDSYPLIYIEMTQQP